MPQTDAQSLTPFLSAHPLSPSFNIYIHFSSAQKHAFTRLPIKKLLQTQTFILLPKKIIPTNAIRKKEVKEEKKTSKKSKFLFALKLLSVLLPPDPQK